MEAMSEGVYDIWGQSIGYPGFPAPGTANELQDWLDTRLPRSQHYYAAYYWASANDVRAAVRVRREVRSVAVELQAKRVPNNADVNPTFDGLTGRLRDCLGPIRPPPWGWGSPPGPTVIVPNGRVTGYAAVFPVRDGHELPLKSAVERLPSGSVSPFRSVPGTHFARLAVLDKDTIGRYQRDRKTVPPRNSYLLFAADFDATTRDEANGERFIASIYANMEREVKSIWSHCYGFDAADRDFGATFLKRAKQCRRDILAEFIDCPDQSVRSVIDALSRHREFVNLVRSRNSGGTIQARHLLTFL